MDGLEVKIKLHERTMNDTIILSQLNKLPKHNCDLDNKLYKSINYLIKQQKALGVNTTIYEQQITAYELKAYEMIR